MTKEQLKEIIENHQHWINEDCDGWQNMRANLSGANLSGADLSGANLSGANLSGAYLSGADLYGADLSRSDLSRSDLSGAYLSGANLSGANLSGAYLSGAYLYGADLPGAYLYGADLHRAYLYRANLSGADLYGANLSGANLSGAYLSGANLSGANLSGANLSGAYLSGANLSRVKNFPLIPYACPDFGMFIGYKRAGGYIVELEIPEDAKRVSATGRKCRCDKAKVLRILTADRKTTEVTEVRSNYDHDFIYKVGEAVEVKDFNEDRWNECSAGIHFFINFMEAVQYI